MKILLVNDDGINAPGLRALYQAVKDLGEITIVAPQEQQSATSHAITIDKPLYYEKYFYEEHAKAYAVSGTPVDCVKIALNIILDCKPDLVLSGINWGANLGASIIYSGTVGAALEASFHQIPAIAFSLKVGEHQDFNFAMKVVKEVMSFYPAFSEIPRAVLNVNIPNINEAEHAGYKVTHQTHSSWLEAYTTSSNGNGERYHVLSGELLPIDEDTNGDIHSITRNYVSLTPVTPDFTNYQAMEKMRKIIN